MRTAAILFILCVSIGSVSPWFWSSWTLPPVTLPPLISTILAELTSKLATETCSYFSNHTDRAVTALKKINDTLYKTSETAQDFALTLAYINNPVNQAKLVGGTSTCTVFYNELTNQIVADCNNKRLSANDALQNAFNGLQNVYNILIGVID